MEWIDFEDLFIFFNCLPEPPKLIKTVPIALKALQKRGAIVTAMLRYFRADSFFPSVDRSNACLYRYYTSNGIPFLLGAIMSPSFLRVPLGDARSNLR
jgi:hypothetical protein